MALPPTKELIEQACLRFLEYGVGPGGSGTVIIRSGHLGAYIASRARRGRWIPAFWGADDAEKVVDVTGGFASDSFMLLRSWANSLWVSGAGNSFLGGLAAGLLLAERDVDEGICNNARVGRSLSCTLTIMYSRALCDSIGIIHN